MIERKEAARLGVASAIGMTICCTLTALLIGGGLTTAISAIGGSLGLAALSGLLCAALLVAHQHRRCLDRPATSQPLSVDSCTE